RHRRRGRVAGAALRGAAAGRDRPVRRPALQCSADQLGGEARQSGHAELPERLHRLPARQWPVGADGGEVRRDGPLHGPSDAQDLRPGDDDGRRAAETLRSTARARRRMRRIPNTGHPLELMDRSMTSTDDNKRQLLEWIEADREELIAFFRQFVRCRSPNPPGDTLESSAHVRAVLDEHALPYRTTAPNKIMPNIVASFDAASPGRHLVLNGHMDVFPV